MAQKYERTILDPRSKLAVFVAACFSTFSGMTQIQEFALLLLCCVTMLVCKKWRWTLNVCILISEHRLWYLNGIADRYILMDNGCIIREYNPKEINALTPQEGTALGLRAINQQQLHTVPETATLNLNQEQAIEIHGLTFNRGQRQVLDIRRLNIPKGAIVAVVGENGAGKSTLSLCLAGLLRHSGTIRVGGKTIPNKQLSESAFLVMQEAGHQLFSDSVMGELALNNASFSAEQAQVVLNELGLQGLEERHPGALSGGQQQRLSLATAICNHRPVMLYDEPTSGQDGENLIRTAEIIRKANEKAVCSLIVSHDPELIVRCATHILHIHGGEAKKFLPLDERGITYMWKVFGEDAQRKKPQKTGIPRLLEFTGRLRLTLSLSEVLAGVGALLLLAPYLCVYFAARELLDFLVGGSIETSALVYWGLWALGFELAGLVVNFIALLLSHNVAFHTQQNLKMAVLEHLSKLPLGYFEENNSGKLRKIIDENSRQTESYLAHQLPDLVGAQVSMIASWRLYTTDGGFFYMASEGEIESHRPSEDNANEETIGLERLFGDSWFSEKARTDMEVLKKEFRELAKKYHPDVSTEVQAADIFKEISAEYDLLRWSEENSSQ